MTYKELREKLYNAVNEADKVSAFGELDELFDDLQAQLDDLRNANALLFAKYGSPEDAVPVEEEKEEVVEEEPIDIKDIIFNDEGDEE